MGTPPESKSKQQFLLSDVDPTNSAASSIQVLFPSRPPAHIQDLQPSYQQHPVTIGTAHPNISGTPLMVSSSNQLIFAAPTSVNEFSTGSMLDQAATFLQLSNQTQPQEANNNITSAVPPYIVNNFSQLVIFLIVNEYTLFRLIYFFDNRNILYILPIAAEFYHCKWK